MAIGARRKRSAACNAPGPAVATVRTGLVGLLPIWNEKSETARQLYQQIGAILKWAVAQRYRQGNPTGDAFGAVLPKNGAAKKHHRAVPHAEVSAAISTVPASDANWGTVSAIEFPILTAARTVEVRKARWDEVDFETMTWTVPGGRCKSCSKPARWPTAPA